ncbi:MAG: hypothetical protein AAF581_01695 [Planctomycetota bacterium]
MSGRRSVFSNSQVLTASAAFIPVADEVFRLQGGDDPECLFFQAIAEQGHYRGGARGRSTRQGIYAFAPSGQLLASVNTLNAGAVTKMLQEAQEKWDQLPAAQRGLAPEQRSMEGRHRWEWQRPKDGLVLQTTSRDLPRSQSAPVNPRPGAWNRDYAWFTRDEARSLVPDDPHTGSQCSWPRPLVERLVRFHLVDNVRGQSQAFDATDIVHAALQSTVTRRQGSKVHVRVTGQTHAVGTREWRDHASPDRARPRRERGFVSDLLGYAVYDVEQRRFVHFDVVAVGTRWGATQFNGRRNDTDAAPIGVTLRLSKRDFVAPAFFQLYGWPGSQHPGVVPLEPTAQR